MKSLSEKSQSILFAGIILSACTFTLKRSNSEEDVNKAKSVCIKYMDFCKQGLFDSALVCTKDLNVEDIKSNVHKTDSILGKPSGITFSQGASEVECQNAKCSGSMTLTFVITRKKTSSKKIIYLEQSNELIKIVGFEEKFDL